MVQNLSLTNDMRNELLRHSLEMYARDEETRSVRGDTFEGRLTCLYKHGMLGSISGVVFTAHIESDGGSGKVNFVIRSRELKDYKNGYWIDEPSMGEFPEPYPLH